MNRMKYLQMSEAITMASNKNVYETTDIAVKSLIGNLFI